VPQLTSHEEITILAPRDEVFDWFLDQDLSEILEGYGPMAAVEKTTGQTGPWDEPGSARTVHLSSGHTVRQTVTDADRPAYFAYEVDEIESLLRHLSPEALSEWQFRKTSAGTELRWTYTHETPSIGAAIALYPLVTFLWEGYMTQIIETIKANAESAL
jgi:hypothetical protein